MTAKLVMKFIQLQKMPIERGTRIIDLVAKFNDFPWAQDTIMAAHQLEDVLIAFLYRHLNISSEILNRWR